jgi:superfamily I DNA/RNA helicase
MVYKPSDEQLTIINCNEKLLDVQAGPGTGKTTTLLNKIKYISDNRLLKPTENILFCSFTNALTSSNLSTLAKDNAIDLSRVRVKTIDSLLVETLCKLNLVEEDKKILLNFNGNYVDSRKKANELIDKKNDDIDFVVNLLVKRYPYILIDEIQDIRSQEENGISSPKYKMLEKFYISPFLKQLITVGDNNQSIFNKGGERFQLYNGLKLRLTQSFRNNSFTDKEPPQLLEDVLNDPKQTELLTQVELIEHIKRNIQENTHKEFMFISPNVIGRLDILVRKDLLSLPVFVYGGGYWGQYALAQAVFNSIFWFNQICNKGGTESLDSILRPFYKFISPSLTPLKFKCRYFQILSTENTSFSSLYFELIEMLNVTSDNHRIKEFQNFYTAHSHLHNFTIKDFRTKFIATTAPSAKGLDADFVYLNCHKSGFIRNVNLKYVACTRHKQKFYLVNN